MSWVLFFQVLVLACLLCSTAVAIAEKRKPKPPKRQSISYFGPTVPEPKEPFQDGDTWINPAEGNCVYFYHEKTKRWIKPKVEL